MAMIRRQIKNIAFFGFADFKKTSRDYQEAFSIAQLLAKSDYTIVNGGGPGIMDAATQGAESVSGETLAITFSPQDAPGFEGRYLANRVDKEIRTSNYIDRMFKLLEHADCFIIFKGGSGTLSEWGTAWVLAKLYYPHHKPFILYGRQWHKIIATLKSSMKLRPVELKVFKIVDEENQIIPALIEFEKEMSEFDHSHCRICKDKAFMT
ncbi:MAG: LOG family protein [Patescibacteria group bacterium]|nr:LOG family protein [Candidatus Beckwithbacteria bacterium]MDZ4228728.1 LOG family protein [Patescibacteria group bacterium]